MVIYDEQKDDDSILENNQYRWEISYLSKHLSYVKTELPSSFSCKIDILWVVPFLQNRGHTYLKRLTVVQLVFVPSTSGNRFTKLPAPVKYRTNDPLQVKPSQRVVPLHSSLQYGGNLWHQLAAHGDL